MPRLGQIMTHLRLVLRMGQATETDIIAAHHNGDLSQEDWADMVRRCRGCEWAKRCPEWLDDHECIAEAPETCPNRERFAEIKAKQAKEI